MDRVALVLVLLLIMRLFAQRAPSFNQNMISRQASVVISRQPSAENGHKTDQVDGAAPDGSSLWQRLRSGDASMALKAVVGSKKAAENAEHAESVQVGESARPSIFRRRPSMFTASADDVSSIEVLLLTCRLAHMLYLFASDSNIPLRINQVERAKAISRAPSQASQNEGSTAWKRLQSGGASGIVLRAASMLSNGKQVHEWAQILFGLFGSDAISFS